LISNNLKFQIEPKKKISFRKDIFASVNVLASNWEQVLSKLELSVKTKNFEPFFDYIRSIKGLGVGSNCMLIKIPLILRELRCQNIFTGIPGDLCCVPDTRVCNTAKELNIKIIKPANVETLKECSKKIYQLFGDLYDLPLFAYEDLIRMGVIIPHS